MTRLRVENGNDARRAPSASMKFPSAVWRRVIMRILGQTPLDNKGNGAGGFVSGTSGWKIGPDGKTCSAQEGWHRDQADEWFKSGALTVTIDDEGPGTRVDNVSPPALPSAF